MTKASNARASDSIHLFPVPTQSLLLLHQACVCLQVSDFVKNTATTFAPRPSTATRNPAYKGESDRKHAGSQLGMISKV